MENENAETIQQDWLRESRRMLVSGLVVFGGLLILFWALVFWFLMTKTGEDHSDEEHAAQLIDRQEIFRSDHVGGRTRIGPQV